MSNLTSEELEFENSELDDSAFPDVAAVERAAFDTFMQKKNARVVIDVKDGQLTSEVSETIFKLRSRK
jgi:hypothetical protein